MSTADLKLNIHKLIDGITDSSVLQAVYTLLSKSSTAQEDWYDNLSDEAKAAIDKGIEDADKSNFVPFDEIQAKVNKLLGR